MKTDSIRLSPLFIVALLVSLYISACSDNSGRLLPFDQDPSPERIFAAEPELVTFSEIQEHPEDYKDRLIRVTGNYYRIELPKCFPYSGYNAEWMLVSEDLRLDAVGFETLIHLIPNGTLLTVDGFFRLYEGPLGCGKGAPTTTAWFLETIQIVQPNPLVKAFGSVSGSAFSTPTPLSTESGSSIVIPTQTQQPNVETPTLTNVPTGTPTPSVTPPSIGTATVTPTESSSPTGTLTITPTPPGTSTTTITPTRTPTASPTITGTPIATPTGGIAPTQPPLPTTYPGATATMVPTSPYP